MVCGPRYECPFEAVRNKVTDLIENPCFVKKRAILMTQTLVHPKKKHNCEKR
jgi:hypothetical protein